MDKPKTKAGRVWQVFAFAIKKVRLSTILFLLAGLMIVAGFTIYAQPDWMVDPSLRAYNEGVAVYHLPPGSLPASADRPAEWPLDRARAYFEIAASDMSRTELRALSLYNLGTMLAREAYASHLGNALLGSPRVDMTEAVLMLAESIRLDPENENAKYNLEVLEQVLSIEGEELGAPGPGYSQGSMEKGY